MSGLTEEEYMKLVNEKIKLTSYLEQIDEQIEDYEESEDSSDSSNSSDSSEISESGVSENIENSESDSNSEIKQEREISEEMQESLKGIEENCLIISEKNNKVILPFKHSDLEELYKNNEKYETWQDVIKDNYVVKLSEYKHPVSSRFREAYKLMREREKAGIFASLNFALQLAWNSYLNPAVITACKNKEELDIYLDCLYNSELDEFHIFDVKYEYTPLATY